MKQDGLSGLPLYHSVPEHVGDATRIGVFVDVDGFVWMNDYFGYGPADAALIQVAATIDGVVRSHGGATFRIGGDEFLGIMPTSFSPDPALGVAREIVRAVRALQIDYRRADAPSRRHLAVNAVLGPVTAALASRISEVKEWISREVWRAKAGDAHRCEVVACVLDEVPPWAT
jgi:diguanylate cyclase (GGDEF)-like protein